MRFLISLLAGLLAWSNVAAEEATLSPEAELQSASVVSAAFVDPELMDTITDEVIAQREHEFRDRLLVGPFFESLKPDTQRSLTAYVDTIPQLLREEVRALLPVLEAELTQRLVDRFSERELAALAFLFESAEFRAGIRQYALASLQGGSPTFEVTSGLETLVESANAQGAPHTWDVMRVVGEANTAAQLAARPRIEQRVLRGLCDALGEECPPHVRGMLISAAN